MRVRDHVAISTAAAALSRRWLGRDAALLWAGAVLIDFDHYLAFWLQERRVSPGAALRFYSRPAVPDHWATRAFHTPLSLIAVACLGARQRRFRAVALGMWLHVALDASHETRMNRARSAALERDNRTCQACGAHAPEVATHVTQQPWVLPSYRPTNVVCLCTPCHVRAHETQASPA